MNNERLIKVLEKRLELANSIIKNLDKQIEILEGIVKNLKKIISLSKIEEPDVDMINDLHAELDHEEGLK